MPAFETILPIRFGDIDHAKILYYPQFYHYFHQAFEEVYPEKLGIHYQHVLDVDQVGFPAVHQETDFISPVRYGESVLISISTESVSAKSVTLNFEMFGSHVKDLKARTQMVLACLNMETFKSMILPTKYRQLFESLKP